MKFCEYTQAGVLLLLSWMFPRYGMSKVRPPQPFLFSCSPLYLFLFTPFSSPIHLFLPFPPLPCTFSSSVRIFLYRNQFTKTIYIFYLCDGYAYCASILLLMSSTSIASLIISFPVHSCGPPIFSVPRLFTSLIPKCVVDLFFPFD